VKKEREVEVMQQKDAWMFPVFGSGVLFGLFLVFKYFHKDYINILFHYYFSVIGGYAVSNLLYERFSEFDFLNQLTNYNLFTFPQIKWVNDKPYKVTLLDALTLTLGGAVGLLYFFQKNWIPTRFCYYQNLINSELPIGSQRVNSP
jgi:minor histocompatibility antigen H13